MAQELIVPSAGVGVAVPDEILLVLLRE